MPLGLDSAVILASEFPGTSNYSLLTQLRIFPKLVGQGPLIDIPQEQGGPDTLLGTGLKS
jgi:hypothetical protein